MGFDISYHPISEAEMHEWYFDLDINTILEGNNAEIEKLALAHSIDEFYVNKYIETIHIMSSPEYQEVFDKGQGYAMAVIQGFFRPFYYTRASAFSFLIEDKPAYKKYTKQWGEILDNIVAKNVLNAITENYMSGVYISANGVVDLLNDYEVDSNVKKELDDFYQENISVFVKALKDAKSKDLGLLEATEVVEPNPMDLNDTTCYSNLFNCDKEGVLIYADVAQKQIKEALARHGEDIDTVDLSQIKYQRTNIEPTKPKKTFWQKLFGK